MKLINPPVSEWGGMEIICLLDSAENLDILSEKNNNCSGELYDILIGSE